MFGLFRNTNDLVVYEADYRGEGTVEGCATVTGAKTQRQIVEAIRNYEQSQSGELPERVTIKSRTRY